MPNVAPSRCKNCRSSTPPISLRGLCRRCALEGMAGAISQMAGKCGPAWDAWRAARREALERQLAELDAEEAEIAAGNTPN